MADFSADLRYAVRSLVTHRAFSVIALAILALGIGANTALFGTLHAAFLRPLPYADPDRLVAGLCAFGGRVNPMCSSPDYYDYREQAATMASVSAITAFAARVTVTGRGEPERIDAVFVSYDLFRTLGVNPIAGRHFTEEEGRSGGPDAVIISHAYWQRRFGGAPDAVGQTLTLNGQPVAIAGIMPAGFRILSEAQAWLVMQPDGPYAGVRRFHNWIVIARLRPGATLPQARQEAGVIFKRLETQYPDSNKTKSLELSNFQDAFAENLALPLLVLFGAVALLLLISCANVAGLLLARASARRTELAVRAALGASRARLVRQLIAESVVLACGAVAPGLVLAYWLNGILPGAFQFDRFGIPGPSLDGATLAFAVGLSILTALVFGVMPALRAAPANLTQDLTSAARASGTKTTARLRGALVAAQVALAALLLVGSGLLVRSLAHLISADAGFRTDGLLTAEVSLPPTTYREPARRMQFATTLRDELGAIPGVTAVGLVSQLPVRHPGNNVPVWPVERPPVDASDTRLAYQRVVVPGYFEAMGIPLVAGRGLADTDGPTSPLVMVISETIARQHFSGENPLGRRMAVDAGSERPVIEIVGVVGDVIVSSLRNEAVPTMYFPYAQRPTTGVRMAVRTTGSPEAITNAIRDRVWRLDPDLPVESAISMETVLSTSTAPERLVTAALASFAAVALLLSAVGLYGVLAFHVAQRVREIGIRVALGARPFEIVAMVVRQGIVLVAVGLAIGLAAAAATSKLLGQLLFHVAPTDPGTFAAVAAGFVVTGLLACLLPARRAARVDPVVALRAE
jgi:putative ABC transport system permease protein